MESASITISRLRVFAAVADLLSFSGAGKRLHMTQPAVSLYIKSLEEAVGFPLFDRSGRTVALTEAGYRLLRHARRVLGSMEELDNDMAALSGGIGGDLTLGATPVWMHLLPPLLARFRELHPAVWFSLRSGTWDLVVEEVANKAVHIGFVVKQPANSAVEAIPCADDEIIVIAPAGHPLARNGPLEPCALETLPFVGRADPYGAENVDRFFSRLGIIPQVVMAVGSPAAAIAAVQAGAGLGTIFRSAARDHLIAGLLAEVHINAPACITPLYYLVNRTRPMSPTQRLFLDYILARLPSLASFQRQ